jgi:hypothetical protein
MTLHQKQNQPLRNKASDCAAADKKDSDEQDKQ